MLVLAAVFGTASAAAQTASVTSTPANGAHYVAGEAITTRLSGLASIQGVGSGSFASSTMAINIGGATRQASVTTSCCSITTVDFSYTVLADDYDADGVAIPANSISGPVWTGMGGATVSRNHAALTNQGAHQVAGSAAAGVLVPVATPRIETVAGNGERGFGGDGGPATAAQLWEPNFIATDAEGDLYIALLSNAIRKVDISAGVITRVAGTFLGFSGDGGPATAAQLNAPYGVAVDSKSNFYITDTSNQRIRKVDGDTGIITTVAGTGAAGYSGDGGAATAAQLNGPYGITTDRSGNVYWTEFNNFVVRKLDVETGMISTFAGTGSSGFSGDGGLATAAQFRAPWGLVFDASGNLYIADATGTYRVRKVDAVTGIITTVAGNGSNGHSGDGGPATAAQVGSPDGLAVDAFGNLYISQFDQHVVRKLDARTGIITTVAGTGVGSYGGDGGPATAALFRNPAGLAFGRGHTDLYISDRRNARIRKVGLFALDYDRDNDGLIEIRTLAQLDAVRHDLDGDGVPVPSASSIHAAAFRKAAAGMGCPDTAADADTDPGPCLGYELASDLDFDTDGDGRTHADGIGDMEDAYYNSGLGWLPIGSTSATAASAYAATFDGGGHVVANLFVGRFGWRHQGLFAKTAATAAIRSLGLPNVRIQNAGDPSGALVGEHRGRIAAVWASGFVRAGRAGGLVGETVGPGARIVASYSAAAVSCNSAAGSAGGLVGRHGAGSIASYSTGTVTGSCSAKAAFASGAGAVAASYWDADLSNIADDGDSNPPEGKSTADLRTPTAYGTRSSDIYSAWDDQDVDGDGASGEPDDDAWDFGAATDHPVLKFGGLAAAPQRGAQPNLAPAVVSDAALREAVARSLGVEASSLTEADLQALSSLSAAWSGVSSLSGLSAASNLRRLELGGNAVADLSELSGLRLLEHLDLSDNAVSDLSALSGLTRLETLLLSGNRVSDISPLRGMAELKALVLDGNAVSDLAQVVFLESLEELSLSGNPLGELSPLCALRELKRLWLADSGLSDLSELSCLTGLERLWLSDNAVADVGPLSGMRRLEWLDLERNAVSDVAPLGRLRALARLRLGSNRVSDAGPLAANEGLGEGDVAGLRGNPLSEDSIQRHVPALRERGATVLAGLSAPWFASAGDAAGRQSFVRLVNRSEVAGEALVWGLDDAGARFGPARLAIGAGRAAHFNSEDLELGNAAKGLTDGVGAPVAGDWRLEILSTLDLEAQTFLRAPGGPLSALHDSLPRVGGALRAAFLPAGRERSPAGALRVSNPTGADKTVMVWGFDDAGRGRLATGLVAPAGRAVTVSASDLERWRLGSGRGLGRGEGNWRLELAAPWPLEAQALAVGDGGRTGNLSGPAAALGPGVVARVPLFPPASAAGRVGVARVWNLGAAAGEVLVAAVDDAGVRAGPVALALEAFAAAEFDSRELEEGGGPLARGVGAPTRGSWRLELRAGFGARVHARAVGAGGYATGLLEAAPRSGGAARVSVFNPGSNLAQRSLLRLVNDGAEDVLATIEGVDDAGRAGGEVLVTVPAGEALWLSAAELESGGAGFEGSLGDGEGKWRLTVSSAAPLAVMSLVEDAEGALSNLSTPGRR